MDAGAARDLGWKSKAGPLLFLAGERGQAPASSLTPGGRQQKPGLEHPMGPVKGGGFNVAPGQWLWKLALSVQRGPLQLSHPIPWTSLGAQRGGLMPQDVRWGVQVNCS